MKLYYWLGQWQLPGQQDKGADKVDVPTDAAGLCAWLNERKVPICLPLNPPPEPAWHGSGDPAAREAEPIPVVLPVRNNDPECPKCKFKRSWAEDFAKKQARAATIEGRAAWIEDEADLNTVSRLATAVALRFQDIAKGN